MSAPNMWPQVSTFLRLVWSEWSSRVTGSLSATLVLLGLGISVASSFGAKVPAESFIQLATWVLAAICGGLAAFSVWSKERARAEVLQQRLAPRFDLLYDPSIPACRAMLTFASGTSEAPGLGFRVQVTNLGEQTISGCEARLAEVHSINEPSELHPMKLTWAGNGDTVDLVKGAPEYIGVLGVISTGETHVPTKDWSLAHRHMFDKPGEYIFRIVVSARNAPPKEFSAVVQLTGDWKAAEMRPR